MEKVILLSNGIFSFDSVFGRSFDKRVILADTLEGMAYNHNIAHGAYFTLYCAR